MTDYSYDSDYPATPGFGIEMRDRRRARQWRHLKRRMEDPVSGSGVVGEAIAKVSTCDPAFRAHLHAQVLAYLEDNDIDPTEYLAGVDGVSYLI